MYVTDEGIGGSYSSFLVNELNCLAKLTSKNNPLVLFEENGLLIGIESNRKHCFSLSNTTTMAKNDKLLMAAKRIINANDVNENTIPIRSVSSTYINYCNWSTYYTISYLYNQCFPVTLYNIYRNRGYNTYSSYSSYLSYLSSTTGIISYTNTNYSLIIKTLNDCSIAYPSGMCSTSGYLGVDYVYSVLAIQGKYCMGFSSLYGTSSSDRHVIGIVGIGIGNSSSDNTYSIFDPFVGKVTISAVSRTFTNGDGTWIWDSGYIGYVY